MRYSRVAGVRLRPVPELGTCIAYTPAAPRLHQLNPTAWLVLELADGRDRAALEAAFLSRARPRLALSEARRSLDAALDLLCAAGILAKTPDPEIPA